MRHGRGAPAPLRVQDDDCRFPTDHDDMTTQSKQLQPELRSSPQFVEFILRRMYSTERVLKSVARILADTIATADAVASASWGVTLGLNRDRLCLNVGRGAVPQLDPDDISVIVTESMLPELSSGALDMFSDDYHCKYISDNVEGIIPIGDLESYRSLRRAHHDAVERSTRDRSVCMWPEAHSPGVIDFGVSTKPRTTRLKDLRIVCSNCHRMLHRNGEVLSIVDLKQVIDQVRSGVTA